MNFENNSKCNLSEGHRFLDLSRRYHRKKKVVCFPCETCKSGMFFSLNHENRYFVSQQGLHTTKIIWDIKHLKTNQSLPQLCSKYQFTKYLHLHRILIPPVYMKCLVLQEKNSYSQRMPSYRLDPANLFGAHSLPFWQSRGCSNFLEWEKKIQFQINQIKTKRTFYSTKRQHIFAFTKSFSKYVTVPK